VVSAQNDLQLHRCCSRVNLPIAIFASLIYGVIVVNWALHRVGTAPLWVSRLILVATMVGVLVALWYAHSQWSVFLGGLAFLSCLGFLMSRHTRAAVYAGRLSLFLSFCILAVIMWRTDAVVTATLLGFILLSIMVMFVSFIARWRKRRQVSLPPFLMRHRELEESLRLEEPTGSSAAATGAGAAGAGTGSRSAEVLVDIGTPPPMLGNFNGCAKATVALRLLDAAAVAEEQGAQRLPFTASIASSASSSTARVAGVSFELRHMNFSLLTDDSQLLTDISLDIGQGHRVAVMGASGSGKSTLLAVLSGRASYGKISGNLRVCGQPADDLRFLAHVTGYVPQDDVLHTELTVFENIWYQAALRLPYGMGKAHLDACVDRVLRDLNLSSVAQQRIGDAERRCVSGGQRKRVSIAMELVSQPKLLFADEPTSGLDSTTSHDVVSSLNDAAAHLGTTVIAVIHQPRFETLSLFDDLVLLGLGGVLVYAGPTLQVVPYFEQRLQVSFPTNTNPADVLLDAIQPESSPTPEECAEVWRKASLPGAVRPCEGVEFDRHSFYHLRPPFINVMLILTDRAVRQILRTSVTTFINPCLIIGATSIVCVVIAHKDFGDFFVQSQFATLVLMLLQGVAGQRTFSVDLLTNRREAQVGMPMVAYFLAKDIAALIEVTLSAIIFTATYGALSHAQMPIYILFGGAWAFVYTVFGLSFIFSLIASPTAAQMSAVVATFFAFCVSGVYEPKLPEMAAMFDGRGWMIPALSPIRWFWGYLITGEAEHLTRVSREGAGGQLWSMGYDLNFLGDCGGVRMGPGLKGFPSLRDSWTAGRGWVCSVSEMLLLGILFRFIAAICLVVYAKSEASGWAQFLGTPWAQKTSAEVGVWKALAGKIFTLILGAFMTMLLLAEIWILGAADLHFFV